MLNIYWEISRTGQMVGIKETEEKAHAHENPKVIAAGANVNNRQMFALEAFGCNQ